MPSGIRKYTCADDSLSTWNQMSCGQANFIKSSSKLDRSTVVDVARRYVEPTLMFVFAHVDHHRGIVSYEKGRETYQKSGGSGRWGHATCRREEEDHDRAGQSRSARVTFPARPIGVWGSQPSGRYRFNPLDLCDFDGPRSMHHFDKLNVLVYAYLGLCFERTR